MYIFCNFLWKICLQCPTFKREADGSETPEPFAAEAKFFTESRLLQRDVQIILESCPNQLILGTILHPVWSHIRRVFWLISLITAVEQECEPFELFECSSYFIFRLDQLSWSKILKFVRWIFSVGKPGKQYWDNYFLFFKVTNNTGRLFGCLFVLCLCLFVPGGCFIRQVYQISQVYFSNSDLFSLDLVSESKITIAQAQSLWQLMLRN